MSTPTRPAAPAPPRTAPAADMFGNRRPIAGLGVPTQKAKDFKGTLRRLLLTKPGPYRSVSWSTYLLKKLFAVRAILPFLFQNCFLSARL